MENNKKKRRIGRIILYILIAVCAIVAAVTAWQWNNIVAVYKAMTSSGEQIAEEMNDTKKQLEEELREKHPTVVGDFTAEEETEIIKGSLSVDDAVKGLNERYEAAKAEYSFKSTGNSETDKKVDKLIGDKVIELYSVKAYYLGQLGQLEAKVKADYLALPKTKRNLVGKKEIVSKYMGTALSLLSGCDAKVAALTSSLRGELKALGADTSIIKTIEAAYENEKALKKAYYLSLVGE